MFLLPAELVTFLTRLHLCRDLPPPPHLSDLHDCEQEIYSESIGKCRKERKIQSQGDGRGIHCLRWDELL